MEKTILSILRAESPCATDAVWQHCEKRCRHATVFQMVEILFALQDQGRIQQGEYTVGDETTIWLMWAFVR